MSVCTGWGPDVPRFPDAHGMVLRLTQSPGQREQGSFASDRCSCVLSDFKFSKNFHQMGNSEDKVSLMAVCYQQVQDMSLFLGGYREATTSPKDGV